MNASEAKLTADKAKEKAREAQLKQLDTVLSKIVTDAAAGKYFSYVYDLNAPTKAELEKLGYKVSYQSANYHESAYHTVSWS